jgi:hypothetical protein
MTGRVRRRRAIARASDISPYEARQLRYGPATWVEPGDTPPRWERPDGTIDRRVMRRLWNAHREELLEDAARSECIPWAAREFEGMTGRITRFDHLRPGGVHP